VTQQVIDGILYSPVNAHALRKGDLIVTGYADMPTVRLTSPPTHIDGHWGRAVLFDTTHGSTLEFALNAPVPRAVGAGVGGVL
jgi:hypothetical protein